MTTKSKMNKDNNNYQLIFELINIQLLDLFHSNLETDLTILMFICLCFIGHHKTDQSGVTLHLTSKR